MNSKSDRHAQRAATAARRPRDPRAGKGTSRTAQYRTFIRAMLQQHLHCQSCGHTARDTGTRRLFIHHMMQVAQIGAHDPAVMDAGNTLVLCSHCHGLFHPGLRDYSQARWNAAGHKRGAAIA